MRKNRFSLSSFLGGIGCTVLALSLCGVAYAASVNANPVSTKIVVDGVPVTLGADEGYNIGDRNFFQLRAIAKIFDVSVEWEAATDTAVIDTTKPYTEEVAATPEPTPTPTQPVAGAATTLANGKAITDENILEILAEIEKEYPDGTPWGASERYNSPTFGLHGGCNAWAFMVSDRIWGENTGYRTHSNIDDIRIGDVVLLLDRVTGEKVHYFVVTSNIEMSTIPGFSYERFKSSDGNMGGKVAWGGYYYMGALKSDYTFTIYTRYPV